MRCHWKFRVEEKSGERVTWYLHFEYILSSVRSDWNETWVIVSRTLERVFCQSLVMTFSFLSSKLYQGGDIAHFVVPTHGRWQWVSLKALTLKRWNLKREKIRFCCYPSFYSLSLNPSKLLFPLPTPQWTNEYHHSTSLSKPVWATVSKVKSAQLGGVWGEKKILTIYIYFLS